MLAVPFITDPEKYQDCLGLWERLMAVDLEKGCFPTWTVDDAILTNATLTVSNDTTSDPPTAGWLGFFGLLGGPF